MVKKSVLKCVVVYINDAKCIMYNGGRNAVDVSNLLELI